MGLWEGYPLGKEEPCMKSGLTLSGWSHTTLEGQTALQIRMEIWGREDLILLAVVSYSFFFNWSIIYNIVLVSAIYQRESAIGIYMHPPEPPFRSPSRPTPSMLSQSPGLNSLCHTENSHWLSVLYTVMYRFPCYSLSSSLSLLPPPHPVSTVSSLCLCLHCCPASRFISVIFPDSICMH